MEHLSTTGPREHQSPTELHLERALTNRFAQIQGLITDHLGSIEDAIDKRLANIETLLSALLKDKSR